MAVKTFTDNTSLPASDINTYLNNGGLVYVTSATLSGSAVQINNCFTSTYAAYRLVFTNLTFSTRDNMTLRLVSGTTPDTTSNYYSARISINTSGGVTGASSNGISYWIPHIIGGTTASGGSVELQNPQLTAATAFQATGVDAFTTGEFYRQASGFFNATTSFGGIWISTLAGSFTLGGLVTVYGYRLG